MAPPLGANFYPYWTLTNKSGQGIANLFPTHACIWNFGNTIAGVTTNTFGKDAQYGKSAINLYGGTIISKVLANPQITDDCPVLNQPKA